MDCADERGALEQALAGATSRMAGYLVAESVPLRDVEHPAADGERRWGTNLVALIEKPDRLSFDAWIHHWHGHHREIALETQATFQYVRNVVLRTLTPDAPPWSVTAVKESFVRLQPLAIPVAGGRGNAANISARFAKNAGQDGTSPLSCRRPRTEIVRSMTQRRRMRAWPPPMRQRSMPSAGAAS